MFLQIPLPKRNAKPVVCLVLKNLLKYLNKSPLSWVDPLKKKSRWMWSCRVSFANFMLNARRQSSPHLAHLATQSFSISKIEPFTPSHSFSQQLLARFVGIVCSLDPFWKTKRASPDILTRNCLSRSFLVLPLQTGLGTSTGRVEYCSSYLATGLHEIESIHAGTRRFLRRVLAFIGGVHLFS